MIKTVLNAVGFAALLLSAVAVGAHATPITYDLTLTPNPGSLYSGTGSFTITSAPPATGQVNYSNSLGNLTALTFLIDGQTFSLAGDLNAVVTFLNGALQNISFAEQIGTNPNRYDLQTSSVYAFYYSNESAESSGVIAAALAPSTGVPEPASLALFGSGLLALVLFRRRRRG